MDFPAVVNIKNDQSRSILFVTSQLRLREFKLAYALKLAGWRVDLIYSDSTPYKPNEYFDSVKVVKTAPEAYYHAKTLSPSLIHVFSGAIDDYIMLFCRHKIAPVVIDLNDIFTPGLMSYCQERFAATREALRLADGYCARDLQIKYAEKLDHCQIPKELIFFPEYCWNIKRENYEKNTSDEIHIVSVGTISLESYGMYDCCYLKLAKMLVEQKIHFHMYPPWCYRKDFVGRSNADFKRDYADFIALSNENPYFHLHDSLPIDQLANELRKYDFGIISGGYKKFGQRYTHFKREYVEGCYSGRITDYLEAGLPVLINEEVAFDDWMLKRYGVGIDLKGIFKPDFKQKLLDLKRSGRLQENIDKAIKILSVPASAERLSVFYAKVAAINVITKREEIMSKITLNNLIRDIPNKIKTIGKYLVY